MIKQDYDCCNDQYFSVEVAADSRRKEFNIKNHCIHYKNKKPEFIFIGDSITHFWELQTYFQKPDCLILNRGIAGDRTYYLRKRFYMDVIELCPTYCVVGIGINDSMDLEGDYWNKIAPEPYENVIKEAQSNISQVMEAGMSAGIQMILTSLLPIDIPVSLHEEERIRYILDMNEWLKNVTKNQNIIFVDYYSKLIDTNTGRIKEGTTYDGLHPNAAGYEIMANTLREKLALKGIQI